jgi:hypothetical protein
VEVTTFRIALHFSKFIYVVNQYNFIYRAPVIKGLRKNDFPGKSQTYDLHIQKLRIIVIIFHVNGEFITLACLLLVYNNILFVFICHNSFRLIFGEFTKWRLSVLP